MIGQSGRRSRIAHLALAVAAALMAPPVVAAAGSAPPLAPSSKWLVEGRDGGCALSRSFGTGDASVVLLIDRGPHGLSDSVRLRIPGRQARRGEQKLWLQLQPSGGRFEGEGVVRDLPDGGQAVVVSVDHPFLLSAGSAASIDIGHGAARYAAIAPTKTADALVAVEGCEDALLASWGIDPRGFADLPIPVAFADHWFTSEDYPVAAREKGEHGRTLAVLTIAPNGLVSDCSAAVSSGSKELDEQTCALFRQRARFRVTKDPQGRPREIKTIISVLWALP